MLNMAPEEPGLYFKLTDNSLTKIGPTHIGVVPPNNGPSGHAGNTIGEQWLDVTDSNSPILKIWDGLVWKSATGSGGGIEIQIQSDWNEANTTDPAFIKNKPTIVSEFSNDAGYITADTQVKSDWNEADAIEPSFIKNKPAVVSEFANDAGYLTDQIKSNWNEADTSDAAFIQNKPTSLSDFNNDVGYLTNQVKSNWNEVDTSSAAFIQNKPTNLSDFSNDPGFITANNAPVRSVNTKTGDVSLALNDLSDVSAASPTTTHLLAWDGSAWSPTPPITAPTAAELQGQVDVADAPDGSYTPQVGHIWVQRANPGPGPVTADAGWTGIGGETVEDGAYIIYGDNNGSPQWFVGNNVTAAEQSDWSVSDSNNNAFIKNKPANVSAFNNDAGYITLAAVPTNVSSFTNDAGYITSAAIPTNVSSFTNDAGYITSAEVPTNVSSFINDAGYITSADIPATPSLNEVLTIGAVSTIGINVGSVISKEILNAASGGLISATGNVMPLDIRKLPTLS